MKKIFGILHAEKLNIKNIIIERVKKVCIT